MPTAGYVYIVQGEGTRYIKIGKTTKITKLIGRLAPGCPFPLCLLYAQLVPDMDQAEYELLALYKDFQTQGNWCELPDTFPLLTLGERLALSDAQGLRKRLKSQDQAVLEFLKDERRHCTVTEILRGIGEEITGSSVKPRRSGRGYKDVAASEQQQV